jgi:Mn-dependent DtxR family transcriptional regulator
MITAEIGFNAGKIWELLNEKGEQPVKEMIKKLKLSTSDFHMAMGWLAREGKISYSENKGIMSVSLKG